MRVHQLLSGAGPRDAVTNQALAYRARLRRWGHEGSDHAAHIAPGMDGGVRPLHALRSAPEDLLIIHYSAYAPRLRPLLELPNRKLLVSHNVTPARYLWAYEPVVAIHCAVGRAQLPEFARAVDIAAGVSEYNVAELRAAGARETAVIPIVFDREALPAPGPEPGGPPTVLFVGRVTPHKRQDLVMRAFALYRRQHAPDARLVLVGEALSPTYGAAIRRLAEELEPGAITLESGLSAAELWRRYAAAHAFLCLSEHEGFCVPLLEAFHFGVPVVSRPSGGIPEVAGDAALLVADEDLAVVAELVRLAVGDSGLRAALRERARERLEVYTAARAEAALRDAISRLASL